MKFLLSLLLLVSSAFAADKGKVLVAVSSESKITLKDGKTHETGFYMNELLVPLKQVIDAGYTPVFANPKGNPAVMDASSDNASHFGNDEKLYQEMKTLLSSLEGLRSPKTLASINAEGIADYAGVLVPGGHAPMEDLATDPEMGKLLSSFHQAGKPTGLICHGPIALLSAVNNAEEFAKLVPQPKKTAPQKDWAYYGYQLTVFSTPEEKEAEKSTLKGKIKFYLREHLAKQKDGLMVAVLATVQYYQALRISEAAALYWEDVYFDWQSLQGSRLKIIRSMVWLRKKGLPAFIKVGFKNADSNEGIKEQPMFPETFDAFLKIYRENAKGLIFSRKGKYLVYQWLQKQYDRAFIAAGLPYRGTHIMRHGGCSRLFDQEKGDLGLAKQLLGNASYRSVEVYAHRSKTALTEVVAKHWEGRSQLRLAATGCNQKTENENLK